MIPTIPGDRSPRAARAGILAVLPLLLLAAIPSVLVPEPLLAQRAQEMSQEVRQFVVADAPVIALRGVTVVDGTGVDPVSGRTILIRDGRIAAVGPAGEVEIPEGAEIHDLPGHTVIPGIIGMHNHTFYTTAGRSVQLDFSAPRLYLGSGVTTIRTTGAASPYSEISMMRGIDEGRIPGPRMHITGPYLTGVGGTGHMLGVETAEDARRVVAYWAEEGATWFKAYTRISGEALGAAIQEAHSRGLGFTGHLCSVSYREAVALGIDNLEHGLFTNSDYVPGREPDECPTGLRDSLRDLEMDSPEVQTTIREMVENGVAMTSTLAVYELTVPGRPPLEERTERILAPEAFAEYMATRRTIEANADRSIMPEVFRRAQDFEVAFVQAGGLLAAGVDATGNGGALPGFGDQRNHELLIEAGFSPVESLQIMTLNGARILGNDHELGSVEPGKIADLVLLAGDPVERPEEIRNVVWVFKDGIAYDGTALVEATRGIMGIR